MEGAGPSNPAGASAGLDPAEVLEPGRNYKIGGRLHERIKRAIARAPAYERVMGAYWTAEFAGWQGVHYREVAAWISIHPRTTWRYVKRFAVAARVPFVDGIMWVEPEKPAEVIGDRVLVSADPLIRIAVYDLEKTARRALMNGAYAIHVPTIAAIRASKPTFRPFAAARRYWSARTIYGLAAQQYAQLYRRDVSYDRDEETLYLSPGLLDRPTVWSTVINAGRLALYLIIGVEEGEEE